MSRIRVRTGWFIGIGCLFVLFLALPLASPAPVKAYWDPKITAGPPKDPGTPFEEPEGSDPDTGGASGPETRPAHEDPIPGNVAPGSTKIAIRSLLLKNLIFILMHP